MMKTRFVKTWILAAFAFASLATVGLAQVHAGHPISPTPPSSAPGHTPPAFTASAAPMPTFRPITPATPLDPNKSRYIGKVAPGTHVPLSRLPHTPFKSMMNTAVAKNTLHGRHFHPMSASGATLSVTATAGCASGGTNGDIFNVGCLLSIQGSNMNLWQAAGTDTYEYFVISPTAPNVATAIATGAGCATITWTGNSGPACSDAGTTLSIQGTYEFLIYDTTKKQWVTSFFANAGQTFSIQVFEDAFHTSQQYQFDTGSSGAAYIYLQNVATSGQYVMYIQSTGVNVYCAYMSPAGAAALPLPSPRPTGGGTGNNLLCDPTQPNVTGVNAPGGALSLTWALTSSLEAGLYTVSIYDQAAGTVLGSVQVSLTSGGGSLQLTGNTSGMNASPAPFGATGTNLLAWNASTDQAVGGVIAVTQQVVPSSKYQWTITDPSGRVVSTPAAVNTTNSTVSNSFLFSAFSPAMHSPGQYASNTWGVQLYDVTNNKVEASQAYQIVGYHATTQFIQTGVASTTLNFAGTGLQQQKADFKITNDGNLIFGVGDSFSGIEFTEGPYQTLNAAFKPPGKFTPGGVFGGVTTATALTAPGEACGTATGCTLAVTDSNGAAWTFTTYCSATSSATPSAASPWDQCVFTILPNSTGTVLPPGASIDVPNLYWFAQVVAAWPCYSTPCFGTTSVLPTHGLSWSQTNNLANPIAWTPVAFGGIDSGLTLAGNVRFDYQGSRTITASPTCAGGAANAVQGASPWLEGHYFQPSFTRADYQNSTPFTLGAPRCNVAAFFITNESTPNGATSDFASGGTNFPEIAIGFPTYFTSSQIVVDPNSTATWTKVTCPSTYGASYLCFNGPTIAPKGQANSTATLYLDMPLPVTSFAFQEMAIQAFSTDDVYIPLTNDATAANSAITAYGYNGVATTSIDSLQVGAWSLNANLMTAAFTPNTVGSGQNPTPLTIVVGNTSTAADPNPDAIDEVVIEQTTNKNWTVSGTPTVTGPPGPWTHTATFNPSGNTLDYYFGICSAMAVQADGPPQTTGVTFPLSTPYPSPPPCAGSEPNVLVPGQSATINMNIVTAGGLSTGTQTFTMYAHGANGGGWTQPKTFTLTVNSESASGGFQSLGATCPGTAVATNTLPTATTNSNCFVYTIKNTSVSSPIGTIDIAIPAFDINGLGATSWSLNGSPITTNIKLGTISGGVFTVAGVPAGCAINPANTFNPVGGTTDGQIEVKGCTGLTPTKILAVEFQATSPGSQSDTYNFPATIDTLPLAASWIGDTEVQESFSIGLTVVVDPSNPGPGGSTPVVACPTCGFSAGTIDFGPVTNGGSSIGTNVVRATVIYSGATTGTQWTLEVNVVGTNPTCTGAGDCNASGSTIGSELITSADKTIAAGGHSNTKCGTLTPQQTTFAAVPNSASPMVLSKGTETSCAPPIPPDWDTIQNYIVQVGTEPATGHTLAVQYTLIP
jgi:hypothetical protein